MIEHNGHLGLLVLIFLFWALFTLGVAFPVTWTMLEKKGNSNSCERMDLLDQFWQIFPDAQVSYVCGDREFIGKEWLTYLMIEPQIPFRLRIKADHNIGDGQKSLAASIIFAHLQIGESQTLSGKRWVWGRQVYVCCFKVRGWRITDCD